ncbi:MAG TPA: STAS domain-containing protein [Vicinamibacterales bacterium]|nr:STAS domain-containing protein [Vicinamibacterales bacterium]
MASRLDITESRVGDVAVISLTGRLVPDEEDILLSERIDSLAGQGFTKVVVDLHDVTLVDSGGIGVLAAKFLSLRRRGGDLRLARLTERTERVLSVTHLLTVFEIFESVEQAVRSFGSVPSGVRA